jgi:DNA-binding transcriptional MocR family regulator
MNDGNADDALTQALRARAAAGAPGERLPSVRALMAEHRAGPATVQRAVARLAAEGLVEARPGRGTFVVRPRAGREREPDLGWQAVALGGRPAPDPALGDLLALPRPGAIPLGSGYTDEELQPLGALAAALARAARRPGAWGRLAPEGLEELRAWFAREAGGRLRAHELVLCPGGQSALGTALRALAAPGEPVLVESPAYLGALAAARGAGLRPVPVPTDADGVRPDLLAAALAASGARLVVLQPLWANPTGATLAPGRRAAVLEAVARAGAFLVEDDWSRGLGFAGGREPAPLAAEDEDGHVVYVRSLTKAAAPSLRVAALGARGAAGARLRAARLVDDFLLAGPLQQAALELVASPGWARHRRRAAAVLRERHAAALRALAAHAPAAGSTSGARCPAGPTTRPWRPPPGPPACSSPRGRPGSPPRRRGPSCASAWPPRRWPTWRRASAASARCSRTPPDERLRGRRGSWMLV